MSAEDEGRTEDPTAKKLEEAREKGDIPQTQEAKLWASLLSAFIIIAFVSKKMAVDLQQALVPLLDHPHTIEISPSAMPRLLSDIGAAVAKAVAWPFAVVITVTLIVLVGQTRGFMWVPKKALPDPKRINPLTGLKRLVSPTQLIELGKNLVKLILVGAILTMLIAPHIKEMENLAQLDLVQILTYTHDRVFTLAMAVVIVMSVLVGADYWYQYHRFIENLKMTKQEVRDEMKQQDGDPMVKGKIRSLRAKRAKQRMMQAVPSADVVVTNPTHFAVALKYDMETMNAPVLVAKGADLMAKRIRELAEEHEIALVENPPLARALFATVELDEEVPPEHYKAVAEVIGYVMRMKGKLAN